MQYWGMTLRLIYMYMNLIKRPQTDELEIKVVQDARVKNKPIYF